MESSVAAGRFPISISLTLDPEVTVTYNPGAFITAEEAQSHLAALVRQATEGSGMAYVQDITVPAADWVTLDTAVGGCTKRCDVTVETAASVYYPAISLDPASLTVAESAQVCATVEALEGGVRLWAKEIPAADLTGTLALIRGGDPIPDAEENEEQIKLALLQLLKKAAYVDGTGADVVNALEYALYDGQTRVYYPVTNNLTHVASTNPATAAYAFSTYQANLTTDSRYAIDSLTVTMGGVDITASACTGGAILIQSVTGPIVITAGAVLTTPVVYSLTSGDFTYGVGNQNTAPAYCRTINTRASYTAFDLLLETGGTYAFDFVSAEGNGCFGTQFFNGNVVAAVEAGVDFSNNDQYDPGWHEEGTTYTYTVGQVNGSDVAGVRLAVRTGSNGVVPDGFITSLTITKEEV